MTCVVCNNHLSWCTCEDLHERLEAIKKSDRIYIHPETLKAYEEQAKRNLEKKKENKP